MVSRYRVSPQPESITLGARSGSSEEGKALNGIRAGRLAARE